MCRELAPGVARQTRWAHGPAVRGWLVVVLPHHHRRAHASVGQWTPTTCWSAWGRTPARSRMGPTPLTQGAAAPRARRFYTFLNGNGQAAAWRARCGKEKKGQLACCYESVFQCKAVSVMSWLSFVTLPENVPDCEKPVNLVPHTPKGNGHTDSLRK